MAKLPNPCRFAQIMSDQYGELLALHDEMTRCNCCRAHMRADKPLCHFRREEEEGYRFFWNSSCDGRAVVHIGRHGEKILLRLEYYRLTNSEPPHNVAPSLDDWRRLQRALDAANFWSLAPTCTRGGLDGATWLIEGRQGDTYHAVTRWSPRGPIYEIGRAFFELSGPPLFANVTLY